ncbi:cysteine hydrolase [Shewanella frigidimarina]|uniref:Isochorismatase n=1 Tax=Shewanella frigidimarina TaxID=56812 RepID=A0A106C125_SHEFR|nr:cysteine hydrolase [Shewanella frigidimarina]KVX02179.1 isochorismatase [Shewanella frigidimarina]
MKLTLSALSLSVGIIMATIPLVSQAAGLPDPGLEVTRGNTAIVITDPQVDFLSPKGVSWGVVGKSVQANNTVENLETLMKTAKEKDVPLFISPHYYYPHDHEWEHEGSLEVLMHSIKMFDRKSPLSLDGFDNSGADWMEQYKPYINDGKTVVTSPHKMYGPDSNDLVLQLRKRGIDKVILAGMSSNLCTESHLRELMEQGFEVQVVSDATAGAILPGLNGYESSMVNFRMIANSVRDTKQTVKQLKAL